MKVSEKDTSNWGTQGGFIYQCHNEYYPPKGIWKNRKARRKNTHTSVKVMVVEDH